MKRPSPLAIIKRSLSPTERSAFHKHHQQRSGNFAGPLRLFGTMSKTHGQKGKYHSFNIAHDACESCVKVDSTSVKGPCLFAGLAEIIN